MQGVRAICKYLDTHTHTTAAFDVTSLQLQYELTCMCVFWSRVMPWSTAFPCWLAGLLACLRGEDKKYFGTKLEHLVRNF
jgi:hypothetical protein